MGNEAELQFIPKVSYGVVVRSLVGPGLVHSGISSDEWVSRETLVLKSSRARFSPVCAHSYPPFELCTSQHHLPPSSWFDSLTNHLPPAPCWLDTSGAASGSGNSWTSSRSHLSATSSVRVCQPPWSLSLVCTCTATRQSVLPSHPALTFPFAVHLSSLTAPHSLHPHIPELFLLSAWVIILQLSL